MMQLRDIIDDALGQFLMDSIHRSQDTVQLLYLVLR